jgi:hypothetical protein
VKFVNNDNVKQYSYQNYLNVVLWVTMGLCGNDELI